MYHRALKFVGVDARVDDLNDLHERGVGTLSGVLLEPKPHWCLDSLSFISRNPAVYGLIIKTKKKKVLGIRLNRGRCTWQSDLGERDETATATVEMAIESKNGTLLWKMWYPIQKMVTKGIAAFHLTSVMLPPNTRIECEPTSCFFPSKICYDDQSECIKAQFKKFNAPVLMSNSTNTVMCKPTKNGWRAQTLMALDQLDATQRAERVFKVLVDEIRAEAARRSDQTQEIYSVAGHALFVACKTLSIHTKGNNFSIFDEEEQAVLKEYEKNIQRVSEGFKLESDILDRQAREADDCLQMPPLHEMEDVHLH